VSGNVAVPSGYYAYAAAGGVVASGVSKIDNSTISGNSVVADEMVHYHGQYLDMGAAAGGILTTSPNLTNDHSTIAFNKVTNAPADLGDVSGGVSSAHVSFYFYGNTYTYSGDVAVRNTIIARNESNIGGPDVTGSFQSQGHNLIGILGAKAT